MTGLQFNDSIDFVEIAPVPVVGASPDSLAEIEQNLVNLDDLLSELSAENEDANPGYSLPDDFKLSIIVPVYNERPTILQLLAKVHALPVPKEIIVVDDCSRDGTRELLEPLTDASEFKVIFQQQNTGKGGALRAGFRAATGGVVAIQDADLEYDPKDLLNVIRPIVEKRADVVYGSRYLNNREDRFLHRALNRSLTEASNLFTGLRLTDMETCHKAFRRELVADLDLRQNRFGFEPEVTAKLARRGVRFREIAIGYQPRGYDEGKKIGLKDLFNALYCIVRYGLRD